MLDSTIYDSINNKSFSAFKDAVSKEFYNKLANAPKIKEYKTDYDKIQDMKAAFSKINTDFAK